MERWVEFVQGGKVAGREVVSIVPAGEVKDLSRAPTAGRSAGAGSARVEMLKGDDYLRVWINRGGVQLPDSPAARLRSSGVQDRADCGSLARLVN